MCGANHFIFTTVVQFQAGILAFLLPLQRRKNPKGKEWMTFVYWNDLDV
jgi:hypothetical protein